MTGIEAARTVLVNSIAVTALVPAARIQAIRRTQGFTVPAITLQRVTNVPSNHLRGDGACDLNSVQIDFYDTNYTNLLAIVAAARTALYAGGFSMQSENDLYEPETDPELYRITQTWSVFT